MLNYLSCLKNICLFIRGYSIFLVIVVFFVEKRGCFSQPLSIVRLFKQVDEVILWHRLGVIITLNVVAAVFPEKICFLLIFHAFTDDGLVHMPVESDDALENVSGMFIESVLSVEQPLVHLQFIIVDVIDQGKVGESTSEVIDGYP